MVWIDFNDGSLHYFVHTPSVSDYGLLTSAGAMPAPALSSYFFFFFFLCGCYPNWGPEKFSFILSFAHTNSRKRTQSADPIPWTRTWRPRRSDLALSCEEQSTAGGKLGGSPWDQDPTWEVVLLPTAFPQKLAVEGRNGCRISWGSPS